MRWLQRTTPHVFWEWQTSIPTTVLAIPIGVELVSYPSEPSGILLLTLVPVAAALWKRQLALVSTWFSAVYANEVGLDVL